ncbi:hypothetical protein SteCoe_31033 [Stentor coeruleus]|uniref:Uncharacterized protein n=1 Tax=Stentor coeruleus TaxID=5963 RepID=A0A1R2B2C2_9CILI|nr:hypothetical protein SteCoe_31033 [Stentor coeruleus]
MSKTRGKSTEKLTPKLNFSGEIQDKTSSSSKLKSKLTKGASTSKNDQGHIRKWLKPKVYLAKHFEEKVKQLELTRLALDSIIQNPHNEYFKTQSKSKPQKKTTANQIQNSYHNKNNISLRKNRNESFDCLNTTTFEETDAIKTSDTTKKYSSKLLNSLDSNCKLRPFLEIPINNIKNSNTNPSIFKLEKTPGFKTQKSLSVKKKKLFGKKKKTYTELKKSDNESFVEQLKNFLENLTAKNTEKSSEIRDLSELLRSCERSDDNEDLFNRKLVEMTSENERKVKSLEEHFLELKKDNDKLKSVLMLKKSCDDVKSIKHLQVYKNPLDYNKTYYSLTKAFYSLQEENLSLAKQLKEALCSKCKTFINTNNALSDKIVRLRTYLNTE